jgi:hypothetical protein
LTQQLTISLHLDLTPLAATGDLDLGGGAGIGGDLTVGGKWRMEGSGRRSRSFGRKTLIGDEMSYARRLPKAKVKLPLRTLAVAPTNIAGARQGPVFRARNDAGQTPRTEDGEN